jgi:hypothetical protein
MKSVLPGVASLASQIEMFSMSRREMDKKFTRSEMLILSWRSMEMSYLMKQQTKGLGSSIDGEASEGTPKVRRKRYLDANIPDGLPDRFFNKDGEVDLRLVTGEEAVKYLQTAGIKIPVIRR